MWNWRKARQSRLNDSTSKKENFLLVTYDSCRFDSYQAARTPVLDSYVSARQAWAQATFTYPSHAAMFQGILPHSFCDENYYNRFVKQLWRIQHRSPVDAGVVFPPGTKNIIAGFNNFGYYTCGTAAMGWFRHNPLLCEDWQDFKWIGMDAQKQIDWIKMRLSRHNEQPFFAFLNFGETHAPYRIDPKAGSEGEALARRSQQKREQKTGVIASGHFDQEMWQLQVASVEFLDARMGDLLAFLGEIGRDVTVVMCADHGDCFGEEGLYGHGFYHPKVMEVPMAIFKYEAPR